LGQNWAKKVLKPPLSEPQGVDKGKLGADKNFSLLPNGGGSYRLRWRLGVKDGV